MTAGQDASACTSKPLLNCQASSAAVMSCVFECHCDVTVSRHTVGCTVAFAAVCKLYITHWPQCSQYGLYQMRCSYQTHADMFHRRISLCHSLSQPGRGRRSSVLPHMQQQQQSWAAARRANAAARDFTVNALLYDPFQAVLFDYVGGVADARQQLLRCVGDPAAKFTADPARLLRAVRCAARAGEVLALVFFAVCTRAVRVPGCLHVQGR